MVNGRILRVVGREGYSPVSLPAAPAPAGVVPNAPFQPNPPPVEGWPAPDAPAAPAPARVVPEAPAPPALEFQGVSTENLHGVSFSIRAGECVAVFDLSNTSLEDITGLIQGGVRPSKGRVLAGGRPWRHGAGPFRQGAVVIAENPTKTMLFHGMPYLDNLCFLLDCRMPPLWDGAKTRRACAVECAGELGPDIHAASLAGLSRQSLYNLVYCRVRLYRPKIVVCVRPFAEADMRLRAHVASLIRRLRDEGAAVAILSVSPPTATGPADRILVLERGRLVATGADT
jgi:ribose transport system ATP-binding protein